MQSTLFTEGPLFKRLIIFSLPLIAANVLQYFYQFVDMAIVGHVVGEAGLIAVSNASSVAFVINAIVIGLTTGGGVIIARAVGAADVVGQRRAFVAMLAVCFCGSFLLALVGIFGSDSIFRAMGIPNEALDDAAGYIAVISGGSICSFLMNAAAAFFKSQGKGALPLVFIAISAVLNVILDIAFVAGWGLGVLGAAWATIISQGIAAGAGFILIHRRFEAGRKLLSASTSGFSSEVKAVLRVGLPSAIQIAVINLSYVLVTGLLNAYGSEVAAAAGVGLKVSTLAGLPCWAIGSAITTASAQCIGAHDMVRAHRVVKIGLGFNVGVIVAIQVLVQIFAVQLVTLLGAVTPEVIGTAVGYLRITCSINGLFYAAMYSFDSFALGAGTVTYTVSILIESPDPRLKPGMTGKASIESERLDDVLMVPLSAVMMISDTEGSVMVVNPNNPEEFEERSVKILASDGLTVAVEGNLKEFDEIMVVGGGAMMDGAGMDNGMMVSDTATAVSVG